MLKGLVKGIGSLLAYVGSQVLVTVYKSYIEPKVLDFIDEKLGVYRGNGTRRVVNKIGFC